MHIFFPLKCDLDIFSHENQHNKIRVFVFVLNMLNVADSSNTLSVIRKQNNQ